MYNYKNASAFRTDNSKKKARYKKSFSRSNSK